MYNMFYIVMWHYNKIEQSMLSHTVNLNKNHNLIKNEFEDEIHFLLDCDFYSDLLYCMA
jgi:hypothetical protein